MNASRWRSDIGGDFHDLQPRLVGLAALQLLEVLG
jgi:hypothetical protein